MIFDLFMVFAASIAVTVAATSRIHTGFIGTICLIGLAVLFVLSMDDSLMRDQERVKAHIFWIAAMMIGIAIQMLFIAGKSLANPRNRHRRAEDWGGTSWRDTMPMDEQKSYGGSS
jgi:hypothetical protein